MVSTYGEVARAAGLPRGARQTAAALRSAGRLVVNVATLETLGATYTTLKSLAQPVQVSLVNIARGVDQLETLRFEAVNPTFLLCVGKLGS